MNIHYINFLKSLGIIKKDCLIDYSTIDEKTATKLTHMLSKYYKDVCNDEQHAYDILLDFVTFQLKQYESNDENEWGWEYLEE